MVQESLLRRYDFDWPGTDFPYLDPIIDDQELEDYNVPTRVEGFIRQAQNQVHRV